MKDSQKTKTVMSRNPNPEEQGCWFCNIFYCFLCPFVFRIKPLTDSDIPQCDSRDNSLINFEKVKDRWIGKFIGYSAAVKSFKEDETKESKFTLKAPAKPNLLLLIFLSLMSTSFVFAYILILLNVGIETAKPWLMRHLLQIVAKKMITEKIPDFPFVYAVILILCPFLEGFTEAWAARLFYHFIGQFRAALSSLIYKKIYCLNIAAHSSDNAGRILALISSDCQQVQESLYSLLEGTWLPFKILAPLVFCFIDFGVTTFMVFAAILVLFPFQGIGIGVLMSSIKTYYVGNDERSKLTNEIIQGMRIIKFSGLEDIFMSRVAVTRKTQVKAASTIAMCFQMLNAMIRSMPLFVSVACFSVYVYSKHIPQEDFIVKVVPTLTFITMLTIMCQTLPVVFQSFSQVSTIVGRVREFLILPETTPYVTHTPAPSTSTVISVQHCTFQWGAPPEVPLTEEEVEKSKLEKEMAKEKEKKKEKEMQKCSSSSLLKGKAAPESRKENVKENKDSHEKKIVLKDISFDIQAGSLTLIIGSVGCGKSSVASSVVGDMDLVGEGTVCVAGRLAYCPQVAWVANCTARENILFGLPYDSAHYEETVRVCCLKPDFLILPAGDNTAIGERGVNLSGGQKARIQLARAVYANCDVYILDDPLSAVDAHVGRILFNDCISGTLAGKTRVLITNQLQYLSRADKVIVLNDGGIRAQGTYAELKERGIDFFALCTDRKKNRKEMEKEKEKEVEVEVYGRREKGKETGKNKEEELEVELESELEVDCDVSDSSSYLTAVTVPISSPTIAVTTTSSSVFVPTTPPANTISTPTPIPTPTPNPTPTPTPTPSKSSGETAPAIAQDSVMAAVAEKIMTEEEQATGGVSLSTYGHYLLTLMPGPMIPVLMVIYALPSVLMTFSNYWSGKIGVVDEFPSISFGWKILIYFFFGIGVYLFFVLVAIISKVAQYRSDTIIHNKLLTHIMHCPVSFFDTTPIGRIINRFTGDLTIVDTNLYFVWTLVVNAVFTMIGDVIVVGVDTPWYFVIGLPILLLFFILLYIGGRASLNLQRLQAISHSPVISHFAELVNGAGLTSVRLYGQEKTWTKRFYQLNDQWTLRFVLYFQSQKLSLMLASAASSLFMLSVVLIGWFTLSTANFAIALTSAISFSGYGSFFVEQLTTLSSAMTSYERIRFYSSHLPQEIERDDIKVGKEWPQKGAVKFDQVSFRYRPGLPYVLQNVSFDVHAGERIGVCGRTGSGKTSLLYALFRFVELDPALQPAVIDHETGFLVGNKYDEPPNKGHILIDDVDIAHITLNTLRKSVAIIPQDPMLFSGTVRSNIDLSGRFRSASQSPDTSGNVSVDVDVGAGACVMDEELWAVLEMVQMREAVAALPQGLDSPVVEGGANFSCGQRQLLCFARALLSNCRIVVMDEATANVDMETDALIQKTIATQLKKRTIIIIAHRLNTILNSDRILVMCAGDVAEFDSPAALQENPHSAFSSLLNSLSE